MTAGGYPAVTVTRRLVSVVNGTVYGTWLTTAALPLGGGSIAWFCMDNTTDAQACPSVAEVLEGTAGCAADGSDCVLDIVVTGGGALPLSSHTAFLAAPAAVLAALAAPQPVLNATVGKALPDGTLPVSLAYAGGTTVAAAGLPLLVTLTSTYAGRFTINAFTPLVLPVAVSFIPWGPTPDPQAFVGTLRIQHLGQYATSDL